MIYLSYGYSHVYLQNIDVSILFHYGYIHASSVLIYLITAICSAGVVLVFVSRGRLIEKITICKKYHNSFDQTLPFQFIFFTVTL